MTDKKEPDGKKGKGEVMRRGTRDVVETAIDMARTSKETWDKASQPGRKTIQWDSSHKG